MTQSTVGIAGTGRMGTAFARRLIEVVAGSAKDLALADDLARRRGVTLPPAEAARGSCGAALDAGPGGFGGASLSRRVAEGARS